MSRESRRQPAADYYVLIEHEPGFFDWPTLDMSDGTGVPVFTTEEKALTFRASDPRLERYKLAHPDRDLLLDMLRDCMTQGIRYVACDPAPYDAGRATGRSRYDLILRFLSLQEDA
jgi:hypothetical protein